MKWSATIQSGGSRGLSYLLLDGRPHPQEGPHHSGWLGLGWLARCGWGITYLTICFCE